MTPHRGTRSRPVVVQVSAPGTLVELGPALRRAGIRWTLLPAFETRSIDSQLWLRGLPRSIDPDTILVTSRTAVAAGVRPWRRSRRRASVPVEYWAVGPGTARALREAGVVRVHRPPTVDTSALATALDRRDPRTILYLRSSAAGPRLARSLRARGHRVLDVVVYGLRPPSPWTPEQREELDGASRVVVTSPSGLRFLRRRLGARPFRRFARTARLTVLGERSRSAAVRQGFRRVTVAAPTSPQRFARHLLLELRDASL